MAQGRAAQDGRIRVEIFLGGAPMLERRIGDGLLAFGAHHPHWRFSLRGADFRYTGQWLRDQAIKGVLVLVDAKPVGRVLSRAGVPWVHVLPERAVLQPSANVDNFAIGRAGADFFLGKGFLRTAFCGVGTPWSDERSNGFQARMKEAERSCECTNIPFAQVRDWGFGAGLERQLHQWVASLEPGIAVMAAHDALANRLVDVCLQQGLRIPQDVAVLGVGNHELLCQIAPVPISSVDTAVPQVAIQAATLLEAMIEGRRPGEAPLVLPKGVVERHSTDVVVYGNDMVARIVAYIREQAGNGLRTLDLLKAFPVSRRTLSRRFSRYVGHSPATEIREARLRQARRFVEQSQLSLAEIAAACGYTDLSHMTRVFHKTIGMPPGALR